MSSHHDHLTSMLSESDEEGKEVETEEMKREKLARLEKERQKQIVAKEQALVNTEIEEML